MGVLLLLLTARDSDGLSLAVPVLVRGGRNEGLEGKASNVDDGQVNVNPMSVVVDRGL